MAKYRKELIRERQNVLIKCFVLTTLFFSPCCFSQTPSPGKASGPSSPVFSITVGGPRQPIHLGSPIEVMVTLTNTSSKEIYIGSDKGPNAKYKDFTYSLQRDGREVDTTLFHRRMSGRLRSDDPPMDQVASSIVIPHPPGPIFVMTVDLARLYEIKKAGPYTLVVSRFDEDSRIMVRSNTLTLKIVP